MRQCVQELLEARLCPRGNGTSQPCCAQEPGACRLGTGSGWRRKHSLLKAPCRPQTFLGHRFPPPFFEQSRQAAPTPARSPPCTLPDRQQALTGTALPEGELANSRLNGADTAPGPQRFLFLWSLERSCNLQLITSAGLSERPACTAPGLSALTWTRAVGAGPGAYSLNDLELPELPWPNGVHGDLVQMNECTLSHAWSLLDTQ